jgi:hypothetical protein
VEGIIVYDKDVVVVRKGVRGKREVPERGEVSEFSYKSRQRLAFVGANTDVVFRTMITLTYPAEFPTDGKRVKENLNTFLQWLRDDLASPYYLWFLEFQARGAPHIHLLLDWPLPNRREDAKAFRFRVSASWYRIVGSKDTKHLAAGTNVERIRKPDGAKRYAVKYAFKMKQKQVPKNYRNVGRFWGCSRAVTPKPQQQLRCTEDDIRAALEGWEYLQPAGAPLYACLYGAAEKIRAWLAQET